MHLKKNMKKRYSVILIVILCQVISCSSVYKSVIDRRDNNYREGVDLYNHKKYEDALACFKTVSDIEPNYKDTRRYLAVLEKIIKAKENQIRQNADIKYKEALALMKRRQYEDALNRFLRLKNDDTDYDSLDDKIAECRKKLVPKLNAVIKQAERFYNRKEYIQAYTSCQKALIFDPSSDEADKLKSKIEEKLDEKCEKYRDNGEKFYSKKQYTSAREQFKLALKNNPWDNESKDYLNKVNNRINLEKDYKAAVKDFNNADYFKAKSSFLSINNIEPGYNSTEQYMNRINSILNSQLNTFYNKGVALYDKGDYQSAINEFDKVLSIKPDHSMAAEYRQRAQSKLDVQKSLKGE